MNEDKSLVASENAKIQEQQEQEANQLLTLQKMRELEREIEEREQERDSREEDAKAIKDIVKVDNVQMGPMFKLDEAYLVKLEDEKQELSYELYTENELIGISNEEGLIALDSQYIDEKNEGLIPYGGEYLIDQDQTLDPEVLQEQSLAPLSKNELEEEIGDKLPIELDEEQEKGEIEPQQEEKDKENVGNTNMDKMESDLGCDITSCYRILDGDFAEDVLGGQSRGHEDLYLAYSKSRNTFILVGANGEEFEEIQDICGAQGGGEAANKQYTEYDDKGNAVGVDAPSFVMMRRDGGEGALGIDMRYGEISLSKLTPSDENSNKYECEEVNVGCTVRPTPDEVEEEKRIQEERERAIKEKEAKIEAMKKEAQDTGDDENDGEAQRKIQEEKAELDQMKASDDDDYDWSTGRPMPKH